MKLLQLCLAIFIFIGSLFFVYSAIHGNTVCRIPVLVFTGIVSVLCFISMRLSYKEYKNDKIA